LFQFSCQLVPLQVRVCLDPAGCLNDLQWIGGCNKNLYEKFIRIKRDGRKHLVQFFLPESLAARNLTLGHKDPGRHRQQQHQKPQYQAATSTFSAFHRSPPLAHT
jgi:hypothetical protein